ncbi:MAG: HAMP domain-containing sensor histidine kinase [bacterium]|nr:HAMP domain-containing sensor histidine kinase [bacterium]
MPQKLQTENPVVEEQSAASHDHHDNLLSEELLDFLALASHQLRTPLSLIKGYIAMLLDGTFGNVSQEQKVILEKTYTATERMVRLVNNFLDLPRIHVGLMPLNREQLSLFTVLTHVIAEARLQADIKKIPIVWEASPEAPCVINGDRDNLTQAFANILDNAIKYTSAGSITVTLECSDMTNRISIKDTGRGIVKSDLPKLFDKFMRGEDMRELYREGRGLGLYIARQIVIGHGGKVWAESEGEGKGSTFIIELPLA